MSLLAKHTRDVPATILIVEGDILIRTPLAEYLRHCGYRVFEATSTDEALLILQEPLLRVDAVLADAEAPGEVDGFGLRQWIADNLPPLRVILVGSPKRAAEAAGDLCSEGHPLTKPYDHQLVEDRISRLLGARERKAS